MSNENKGQLVVPNRENINSVQLMNLLNVFSMTTNFLLHAQANNGLEGTKFDGGAKSAVETTVIRLCDRIDTILDETQRWTLDANNKLEAEHAAAMKEHTRMLSAQADAYAEITAPHHRLKPTLLKIGPGEWLAFSGDPDNMASAVTGMGTCPEAAIKAFDDTFRGLSNPDLEKFLTERDTTINQNTNEKTTVDEQRIERTEKPTRRRAKRGEDSGGPGPDGPVSPE